MTHFCRRKTMVGAVMVALVFGACPRIWGAGTEKLSTAQLVELCKIKRTHPLERTEMIQRLGQIRSADEVRSQNIVPALVGIAVDGEDEMYSRVEAIRALGALQRNLFRADAFAKKAFIEKFIKMLGEEKEPLKVKKAVAEVFEITLNREELQDRKAFKAMAALAENAEGGPREVDLALRIACVNAMAAFGSSDAFDSLVTIFKQTRCDPLLREAVVRGFYTILQAGAAQNLEPDVPTIEKLKEFVHNKEMPVEIRAEVLKTLANFVAQGLKGVKATILDGIRKVLEKETDPGLAAAAVEAAGITQDESLVPLLVKTYKTSVPADARKDKAEDVKIRKAVVMAMVPMLSAQGARKGASDATALKAVSELLLDVTDPKRAVAEAGDVLRAAVFVFRYLYPKDKGFEGVRAEAVERLLRLASPQLEKERPDLASDASFRAQVFQSLEDVTDQPFKDNFPRWEKWFDQQFQKKKFKAPLP